MKNIWAIFYSIAFHIVFLGFIIVFERINFFDDKKQQKEVLIESSLIKKPNSKKELKNLTISKPKIQNIVSKDKEVVPEPTKIENKLPDKEIAIKKEPKKIDSNEIDKKVVIQKERVLKKTELKKVAAPKVEPKKTAQSIAKNVSNNKKDTKSSDVGLNKISNLISKFEEDIKEDSDAGFYDDDYFLSMHKILKDSFYIPLGLEEGISDKLKTSYRVFLRFDGQISKLLLEKSSGNKIFDDIASGVINRVENFGFVPKEYLPLVSKKGVVVDLCPYSCN